MYRTQRIGQHVPTRGQRRVALALVAALAFTAGAAFGAYGGRVHGFLTTRQAVLPISTSPMGNTRTAAIVGPAEIAALPPQVQAHVRRALGPPAGNANAVARAQGFGPEDIAALPPQIQEQVRGMPQASASGNRAARKHVLSPEDILTLPVQIQEQVGQATQGGAADNAAGAGEQGLGPEDIVTLPPHIQEQVRRALR